MNCLLQVERVMWGYLLYDTESLYAVVLWLIIVRFSAQIDNEHGGIISFFQTRNIYY